MKVINRQNFYTQTNKKLTQQKTNTTKNEHNKKLTQQKINTTKNEHNKKLTQQKKKI